MTITISQCIQHTSSIYVSCFGAISGMPALPAVESIATVASTLSRVS